MNLDVQLNKNLSMTLFLNNCETQRTFSQISNQNQHCQTLCIFLKSEKHYLYNSPANSHSFFQSPFYNKSLS